MRNKLLIISGGVIFLGVALIIFLKSEINYQKKFNSLLKKTKDKTSLVVSVGSAGSPVEKVTEEEFNFQKFLDNNPFVLAIREGSIKGKPTMGGVSYGTGFLLGGGVVVTANHVAYPYRKIDVCFDGCGDEKNWQEVKILWSLITKDIIFLHLDFADKHRKYQYKSSLVPQVIPAYKIFSSLAEKEDSPPPLEKVLVGMKCMVGDFNWKVLGELKKYGGPNGRADQFVFQYNIYVKGCSGAPVFTTDGKIIGIFQEFVPGAYLGVATDIDTVVRAFEKFRQLDSQKSIKPIVFSSYKRKVSMWDQILGHDEDCDAPHCLLS